MKRASKKNAKELKGVFCLPTSAKAHIHDVERCTAFKPDQFYYVLNAAQSIEEGGYPPAVILTSDKEIEGWDIDTHVETQHAENPKNLPLRYVAAVRFPNGDIEGVAPVKGVGLPHWELIPANSEGSASKAAIQEVKDRITANKKAKELEKQNTRNAKGKPTAAAAPAPAPAQSESSDDSEELEFDGEEEQA